MLLAQSADPKNLVSAVTALVIGDKSDLAIVVVETNARQSIMGDALFELQRAEIPKMDAFLGKRLVERYHQRLVFRADRANGDRRSIAKLPRRYVLGRIRANCERRQVAFRSIVIVQNHARIERDHHAR